MVEFNFGRCFLTRYIVRPGQVVENPAFFASIQVDVTGLKAALCKYVTISRFD